MKVDDGPSADHVVEARKISPRAYEPWSVAEDEYLRKVLEETDDITLLSEIYQRQQGAVDSRIRKLMPNRKKMKIRTY